MPLVHAFDPPERFVTGTVGEPGHRTFFLQARSADQVVSVSLEKQQVVVLVERLDELLDELMRVPGNETVIPAITPFDLHDTAPLEQPIVEEFRVGTMALSWDPVDQRVVLEAFPVEIVDPAEEQADDDEEREPEELLLVRMTGAAARAFCSRAQQVVEAGRPDCPFCGQPMDPDGHLCVRANGFKRRL
ncbi:DUF3090 domain-containing protein [Nocardioides jishulii]|uniref:DUF3090 family protein n=1 Tax=Nocardioides jishulii TaxID=2575440 RepID=A0A4U2YNC6_9ACTN|nr:DUF3090 domain-containing protein [Nocardioides jishulii]QCX27537.1 DUF3090 family protein [Nocardioides jishulii]TKI62344.1 DUF3090 family protein [Nocardioides jishulii]